MSELRGSKFMTTSVSVVTKIESEDKAKYDSFYSYSEAAKVISESDIDDVCESISTRVL